MSTPDQDVFSCILSHVHESKTVHAVLRALPRLHPLFPVALHRLWQLPIYLDHQTYDWRALVASDEILDHLLAPDASEEALAIAESIRHLVIAVEPAYIDKDNAFYNEADALAFRDRLSELFERTRNLSRLEYSCYPGIPLSRENVKVLANCERLGTLRVDTAVRPTSDWEDPAPWDIEPFLTDLAPSITSLDLRYVCMTTLNILLSHGDMLATYKNLEHLRMDITEGSWDWNGAGTPQTGASDVYTFSPLRLPALRRFELVVSDFTIHKARAGPLDLVDRTAITDLTLDITSAFKTYLDVTTIQLFMAIDLPMLSHLEVRDNSLVNERVAWETPTHTPYPNGRHFHGLVERFLPSSPHLTSLWVDERALLPAIAENDWWGGIQQFCSVRELWSSDTTHFHTVEKASWRTALHATLSRLESLRVGFGVLDHTDMSLVLSCCDPEKLRQFGFTWDWKKYGREDPISPELLAQLARFPKLTDIHILFPRPETQVSGDRDPVIDARMARDVAALFKCNGSLCRVGMGNSVVWERGPGGEGREIILVADGSAAPDPLVPKFYHAGYLANQDEAWGNYNTTPRRPGRTEETEQLRDLLDRILGDDSDEDDSDEPDEEDDEDQEDVDEEEEDL